MRIAPWMREMPVLFAVLLLGGCGNGLVQETPLPPSQRNATLKDFQPAEMLDHLEEWYPGDWRVHLLRGLTDTAFDVRLASLRKSDSLRPEDPLPSYALASAYLAAPDITLEALARPHVEKALALDPGNDVLRVMLAYVLLRQGDVPRARALFRDPRRNSRGGFYHDRLEEVVLGLFSRTRQLNPYTLTEAVALYRSIPLPPFEKMVDILYAVFLEPLESRPYDIRIRGKQAAQAVFALGKNLRIGSYGASGVLSTGYDQRALGFMFQLKAGEFQTLFHRTFHDTVSSLRAFQAVVGVQAEYQDFIATSALQDAAVSDYLDRWSALIRSEPDLALGEAVERARHWSLWRRARSFRYPSRDDF